MYALIASSVSGATKLVKWFNPRYAMLGSDLVMNAPNAVMDCSINDVSLPKSNCAAKLTASKSTACSALFLFTLRTVVVLLNTWVMTSISAFRYSGSSGVGMYCKALKHLTCNQGEGNK